VEEAVSGYSGGSVKNPYYEYVSSNRTGHAESVAVFMIQSSFIQRISGYFFASHDPTTPDQQGPDRGSSYRSIAFYSNALEKK
jgi:peptide-methionine (S)-S-oxide reductase